MSINANKRRKRAVDGPPAPGWLGSSADTDALVRRARGEVILTPKMIIDIVSDYPRDIQMDIIAKIIAAQK